MQPNETTGFIRLLHGEVHRELHREARELSPRELGEVSSREASFHKTPPEILDWVDGCLFFKERSRVWAVADLTHQTVVKYRPLIHIFTFQNSTKPAIAYTQCVCHEWQISLPR